MSFLGAINLYNVDITAMVSDQERNELTLRDVLDSLAEGRSPILLTERREHLEFFASKLS